MDFAKAYDSKSVEDKIYKLWEESGFFTPENLPNRTKGNFVSTIAPPNITGELHIGHALELTAWDIIIRMKRMQGYKVLWLPGTDHASIGTSVVIEKQLAKEGLTRHKIGREEFLKRAWAWREKYGTAILNQFKRLGLSLDWTRTKFTMDPEYNKAVETAFHHYYKKGWIYKGERVINWCPRCGSSVSDLEVNYVPEKGKLYYIKYGPFTLATARPETKLGDTALAVHPTDERYKKYIDKDLEIESVDNTVPREKSPKKKTISIKVVADESVDKEFGTGIIKVTPAHDFTDAEIGQRHNLHSIKIIDERGKMNEQAGVRYEGLKVSEARDQIVNDLQELGLMEKIEEYDHNVGRCERCNTVIEPLPSKQWFLKMGDLAKLAREAVEKKEVRFHPERWTGPVIQWLDKIRDWNISRQLWWGHKVPMEGEEDVLDTWFSSALWPFASLGWPEKTKDFTEYYPTNFIMSARDILFLWQLRMIFSGKELTGTVPFKDIYIHATVMTKEGKRMSKSLGTGINPIDLMEKYGTDAVRFGIAYQVTDLQDMRFSEDALLMGKKFANKIWNIARYIITKIEDKNFEMQKTAETEIIKKFKEVAVSATKDIDNYQFGQAAHLIYDFIWHDLADKYIEETKNKNDDETKQILIYLLTNSLKLLHPFMPFITEELWSKLPMKNKKLLLVEEWPV
ncbi:MAG: class I tRNA ligase family protein [Patescibacteria group bacterium]